jgi:hypothetical protein
MDIASSKTTPPPALIYMYLSAGWINWYRLIVRLRRTNIYFRRRKKPPIVG